MVSDVASADRLDLGAPVTSLRRRHSVQRVLAALRLHGALSQAQIAKLTDLSPATVSSVVHDLRHSGAAEVLRVNGRQVLVRLVVAEGTIVAVDIAPDKVRGCAFTLGDEPRRYSLTLDRSDPDAAVDLVDQLSAVAGLRPDQLVGVAVAVQAPIEAATGAIPEWVTYRLAAWRGVVLQERFEATLKVPVVVDNDANLASLAEWTWGEGHGTKDFLLISASEGVGSGLVLGGQIFRGGSGMAGDLGHLVLQPDGEVCYCGNRGCLTTLISERAIIAALGSPDLRSRRLLDVIAAAEAGDLASRRVLTEAGRHLGRVVATAAKVIGPDVVAIGGELSTAGPDLFGGILEAPELQNLQRTDPHVRITRAALQHDATLLGGLAAILARSGRGLSTLPVWTD